MSDDEDAYERGRDRFRSERKRSSDDLGDTSHMDTPRPLPSKRGRYGDRPPPPRGGRGPPPPHRDRAPPPPSTYRSPPGDERERGMMMMGGGRDRHGPPPPGMMPRGRGPPLLGNGPLPPRGLGGGLNVPPPHLGGPGVVLPRVALPKRRPFKYLIKPLSEWSKTDATSKSSTAGASEDDEASLDVTSRYFKFKHRAILNQSERIFSTHEGEIWFREQYVGDAYNQRREQRRAIVRRRAEVLTPFLDDKRLDDMTLPFPLKSQQARALSSVLREIEAKLLEQHPATVSPGEDTGTRGKSTSKSKSDSRGKGNGAATSNDDAGKRGKAAPAEDAKTKRDDAQEGDEGDDDSAERQKRAEEDRLLDSENDLDYDEDPEEGEADDAEDAAPSTVDDKTATNDNDEPDAASNGTTTTGDKTEEKKPLLPVPAPYAWTERSFSVKIFPRLELSSGELEKALRRIKGFHKMTVAYPSELSELAAGQRMIHATFTGVKVDMTIRNLRRMMIDGEPLLAGIMPESPIANPLRFAVGERATRYETDDIELMQQLITEFDAFEGLYTTETDNSNPVLDTESSIKMLLYLRVAHSLDFYAAVQLVHEEDMAHPMPCLTLPSTHSPTMRSSEECRDRLRGMVEAFHECDDFEVDTLVRTPEQARDDFISKNTVALDDGTFQCPLSGKRFRGPEFVRTHIINKHAGALAKYQTLAAHMNNYLEDPFRLRILPLPQANRRVVPKDQFGRDVPASRVMIPMRSPPINPQATRSLPRYDIV